MNFFARTSRLRAIAVAFCLLMAASIGHAQINITLKKEFVEKYKNRATTGDVQFTVDHAGKIKTIGSGASDGDSHNAGRSPEIGLPMVAEIMNARREAKYANLMHDNEGQTVTLDGVWRLWCEHAGSDDQIQGDEVAPAENTNPDHVFEIHPITSINGKSLLDSFAPIVSASRTAGTKGREFAYKDASDAFGRYENLKSHISSNGDNVKITTNMAGYNYVEFLIEPVEDKKSHKLDVHPIDDGTVAMARVLDLDGEVLLQKRRVVFVKGTAPERAILAYTKGNKPLRVIGIPRIDLALVSWRVEHAQDNPEVLDWSLPYEMVIVAIKPSTRAEAE